MELFVIPFTIPINPMDKFYDGLLLNDELIAGNCNWPSKKYHPMPIVEPNKCPYCSRALNITNTQMMKLVDDGGPKGHIKSTLPFLVNMDGWPYITDSNLSDTLRYSEEKLDHLAFLAKHGIVTIGHARNDFLSFGMQYDVSSPLTRLYTKGMGGPIANDSSSTWISVGSTQNAPFKGKAWKNENDGKLYLQKVQTNDHACRQVTQPPHKSTHHLKHPSGTTGLSVEVCCPQVSSWGRDYVVLIWELPTNCNDWSITGYFVEMKTVDHQRWRCGTHVGFPICTASVRSLSPKDGYVFRVRAVLGSAGYSEPSKPSEPFYFPKINQNSKSIVVDD